MKNRMILRSRIKELVKSDAKVRIRKRGGILVRRPAPEEGQPTHRFIPPQYSIQTSSGAWLVVPPELINRGRIHSLPRVKAAALHQGGGPITINAQRVFSCTSQRNTVTLQKPRGKSKRRLKRRR